MRTFIGFFLKVLSNILYFLPRSWVRGLGKFIGFLWIDVFGIRRDVIMTNLEIAFPGMPPEQKNKIARQSVYTMGESFSEFFLIPALDEAWVQKNVIFEGVENLEKARALDKGIYFLTLHLGNGDLGANVIAMKFMEVNIITKIFKNKFFNDLWFSIRGAKGVGYIEAHGPSTPFDILKAIKRKAAVVFVVDQFMGKPYGIPTLFFGKQTGTAYGLALFAQKTRSPVVPVYTYQGDDQKVHVVFEPMIDIAPLIGEDKEKTLADLTQSFCDKIEGIIRKHPGQWMWVHRRWKEFE